MILDHLYCSIFANKFFSPVHKLILQLSLKGLGINVNGGLLKDGEGYFISKLSKKIGKNKELIIFDGGANVGDYSRLLIKYFPKSKIYAFEPLQTNIREFKKKCEIYENIKLIPFGLSDRNDKKTIFYPDEGISSRASIYNIFENKKEAQKEEISLINLDDFCKDHKIDKIDLLKLDIEGHEFFALKGAEKLIKEGKIRFIQFEFNYLNAYSKVFMEDFRELLKNYEFYRILPKSLLKIDFSKKIYSEIYGYQNIFAVNKNGRAPEKKT